MPAGNRGKVSRGWVRSVEPRKLAVRVDCGALCAPAAGRGACTRRPRAPESAGRKAPAAAVRPGKSSEARLKAAAGVGVAGSGPSSSRPVSKRSRCSAGARAGLFGTPSRTASSVPAAESGAGRQRAGVEEHLGVARESLVSAPGFRGQHSRGHWKVCRQHRERARGEGARSHQRQARSAGCARGGGPGPRPRDHGPSLAATPGRPPLGLRGYTSVQLRLKSALATRPGPLFSSLTCGLSSRASAYVLSCWTLR